MAKEFSDFGNAATLDGTELVGCLQSEKAVVARLSAVASYGQLLTSPNGTVYRLTVANDGTLSASAV